MRLRTMTKDDEIQGQGHCNFLLIYTPFALSYVSIIQERFSRPVGFLNEVNDNDHSSLSMHEIFMFDKM